MFKSLRAVEGLTGNLKDLSSNELTDVLLDCYIPINQGQFGILAENDSEFFVTPDKKTIFTYASVEGQYLIMPISDKYVSEIMAMQ